MPKSYVQILEALRPQGDMPWAELRIPCSSLVPLINCKEGYFMDWYPHRHFLYHEYDFNSLENYGALIYLQDLIWQTKGNISIDNLPRIIKDKHINYLKEAGLIYVENNKISSNFMENCLKSTSTKRTRNTVIKRKSRQANKGLEPNVTGDITGDSMGDVTGEKHTEKRREEKSIIPPISPKGECEDMPNAFNQEEAWKEIWELYPRKKGSIKAREKFIKQIKTKEQYDKIMQCLKNYNYAVQNKEQEFIAYGSTWFNKQWPDWENGETKPKQSRMLICD